MNDTVTLADMVERALRWYGPRLALADGQRQLTFAELETRSARLANALLAESGERSARVAILLPNCLEFVETDLAVLRAGLTKVPINPRLSDDEARHMIVDSTAEIVVTDAAHEDRARSVVGSNAALRTIIVVGSNGRDSYEQVLAAASPSISAVVPRPDDPSVILYTSGTTGRPKGATWSLRTRTACTLNMLVSELDVAEGDAMLHAAPLSHGSGSKTMAFLSRGARNVVMRKFDPGACLELIDRERITSTFLVPTMIAMLAEAEEASRADLSSLRSVTYGGAPISEALLVRALETFGPIFVQIYGSCEAPHPVSVLTREDHLRGLEQRALLASAGRIAMLVSVTIMGQDGAPSPTGSVGEICISGDTVMSGYWNDPEATAECLFGGHYHSGDVGWMDENGFLYLVDRIRDLVLSGGYNVYPAEVERALSSHAAVAEVAVIGVPDETWGEKVVAYVVLRPGVEATADDLTEHCRDVVAGYKKPREYVFVRSLPKGSTGKILKDLLRARHASPPAG